VVDVEGTGRTGKRDLWLVGVGVDSYPRLAASYQLSYASADAKALTEALERGARRDGGYRAVHKTLLLDAAATVPAVLEAVAALERMAADDVAVLFFAGHGVKLPASGDMVFLTTSADGSERGSREHGIGWDALSGRLAKAKGKVLVLLDACHSGHISRGLVVPNESLVSNLIADDRAGVVVFAAAKGRQLSYEPRGRRGLKLTQAGKELLVTSEPHGYFTAALLRSIAAQDTDRNRDGVIQLSELLESTTRRVETATDGRQTPWVARREMLGDFGLVRTTSR
jgi:uncharacterized caspase-like protein